MKYLFVTFLFLISFVLQTEASETTLKKNVDELLLAFQLQGNARSYLDSYNACVVFNSAKAKLLNMGEPQCKINAIQDLWAWYRTYGYNCGLMLASVKCPGEYISDKKYISKTSYGSNLDPKQQQMMRDFLFGVGQVVSGVFCMVVAAPVGGLFGTTLVASGVGFMWASVNSMVTDSHEKQARLFELENIKNQAEKVAK